MGQLSSAALVRGRVVLSGFCALALAGGWTPDAAGVELYKYVNEEGVVVLDSNIPPRYVRFGYTVLSPDGRVLRVVERQLSPEEKLAAERKAQEDRKREEELEARLAADASLMRLYSKPEDVLRARDTKVATIESFIESANGNLQRLIAQRKQYQAQAAQVERAGGVVTRENQQVMDAVNARISQTELEIQRKREEIDELILSYDRDYQRVKELYQAAANRK